MLTERRLPHAPQVDPALIDAFRALPVANISDNLHRMVGARGLRPFHDGTPMCGTAMTVRTRAGDNKVIHEALELVRPGDVIVVDGGGDLERALIGEIMSSIAKMRGAAGFVLDGAVRDLDSLAKDNFPVFACAGIHLGPYKNGPGEINVPVSIGGMTVNPGDIVVGDGDGITAFSPDIAEALLEATRAQSAKEEQMLAEIHAGTYGGGYSAKAR
ncbi:RraA family protein [Roseovarius sp.]|uniref:Putative 4-hydroxy-4-methyl-2-oxoglutarate aldolase n=1 Tax=Roseovarius nubinhibens TaxID=314263 RepID=A0A348W9J5_9RHOB|nr:RraA family protein [Roseovarius sp.]MAO28091.1 methyltransferase [Roseovarius sp.]MAZ20986.1 methyltransferase [Roseovarius sp.]HAR51207.1 methyltransferase [Roseovarius nubinhibens]|tara:strand:+ start:596 stop:1240 length:645 start_codon:yes stop_codon:yes gene_type:complete